MEKFSSFGFDDVCRSCLSSEKDLLPIDSIVDGTLKIKNCLKAHLNINIATDDGLPQKICLNCVDSLLHIRKFHLRLLKSEEYLLQQHTQRNNRSSDKFEVSEYEVAKGEKYQLDVSTTNSEFTTTPSIKMEVDILRESYEYESYDECNSLDGDEHQSADNDSSEEKDENTKTYIDCEATNDAKHSINSRVGHKLISCLQCNEKFDNRNTLRTHFHCMHGEDNARGFCIQCSTIFPSRGTLMTHLYEHSLAKSRLTCSYCTRTFSSREKVVSHERTHTGEKPYKCEVCGRSFSQSSVLRTHMSLHTGKTVECTKCDKKFSRKSFLKVHMRSHDNIRPYSCHLCEKNYRMKSHLDAHIASHSKERNFPCKVCGQFFKAKVFLTSHMAIHTRPFKCPKCPLQAAKLYSFRIHLVKMHDIHDDPNLFRKTAVNSVTV